VLDRLKADILKKLAVNPPADKAPPKNRWVSRR
jgi:hypothetical protein